MPLGDYLDLDDEVGQGKFLESEKKISKLSRKVKQDSLLKVLLQKRKNDVTHYKLSKQ